MLSRRFLRAYRKKAVRFLRIRKYLVGVAVLFCSLAAFTRHTDYRTCITPHSGSVISDIWVCMHAWEDMDALRESIHSVASQQQAAGLSILIRIKLVIFVDRCGTQPDMSIRLFCAEHDWCTLLGPPDVSSCPSLGSAAAKWHLLSYVGQRISPSDYFTFLDGDDIYETENTLLNIYISHLQTRRPFFAWGRQGGAFSEQCRDVSVHEREALLRGEKYVRDLVWAFCHPRFFRGKMISLLREDDFKRPDGTWLQKATDRPLIYAAIELGGMENSVFMGDEIHVRYRYTDKNGLTRFPKAMTNSDKAHVLSNLRRFNKLATQIHVVVAVYDRDNTEMFLEHLSSSVLPEGTVLRVHIANNMPARQPSLVSLAADKTHETFHVKVTNMGKNLGGMARFVLVREILRAELMDFVIFIDDDQLCFRNTIGDLWDQRKYRAMVSWFGKSWRSPSEMYWNPTFGFTQIKDSTSVPQFWSYAGTGMSIVDTLIFSDERLFQIPTKYTFVEDVWLSYVIKTNGWLLKRAYVQFHWVSELNEGGQYLHLKATKEIMFSSLKKCDFPFISNSEYASVAHTFETMTSNV